MIPKSWLDTGCMTSVICNPNLLGTNIQYADNNDMLQLVSNSSDTSFNQKGTPLVLPMELSHSNKSDHHIIVNSAMCSPDELIKDNYRD